MSVKKLAAVLIVNQLRKLGEDLSVGPDGDVIPDQLRPRVDQAAYDRFQRSGYRHGNDVADWQGGRADIARQEQAKIIAGRNAAERPGGRMFRAPNGAPSPAGYDKLWGTHSPFENAGRLSNVAGEPWMASKATVSKAPYFDHSAAVSRGQPVQPAPKPPAGPSVGSRIAGSVGRAGAAMAPVARTVGKALPIVGGALSAADGVSATQSDDRVEQLLGGIQAGGGALGAGAAATGIGAVPGGIVAAGSSIPLSLYRGGREAGRLYDDVKSLSESNAETASLPQRLRTRAYSSNQDKLREQSDNYRAPTVDQTMADGARFRASDSAGYDKAVADRQAKLKETRDIAHTRVFGKPVAAGGYEAAVDAAAQQMNADSAAMAGQSNTAQAERADGKAKRDATQARIDAARAKSRELQSTTTQPNYKGQQEAANAAWQQQKSIQPGSAAERAFTGIGGRPTAGTTTPTTGQRAPTARESSLTPGATTVPTVSDSGTTFKPKSGTPATGTQPGKAIGK